ncbi:superoxide dismutase [Xanthomonas graminis]|jgi:Fe-Mn family superoxide dismutase|uniref:Superoxide dismutase n=1 Tax=Xanthomonas graminis pv. graminis TaxID=134874 RepID=A0A1M4JIM0_9XANT|nr:Fe-Mn family superoxide dismutase [Xanthomonas translucens]EKU25010.1 superoxide dismutase [Xanthomonas translucens pv. graminis ART-Xtg29]OAX61003.1 superoxide dismutase [Xanthomonas translucens pv. graminis]UKE52974.1 superoxide dismutase [Xanthomonas translucens pv. graminis]WIH10138.1 superoxide dismutase [Xanthomonas translucens pv. graminis]WIH13538.1 superoxide dismutase [Xanthomonas translucens pv. graminis]
MAIELAPLPYDRAALAPHLSAEALDQHHGQHQRALVERLNAQIAGSEFAELPLQDLVRRTQGRLFQHAAEIWNHEFYWRGLRPCGGGEPGGELAERIARNFGDFARFKAEFARMALAVFGSGWVWLVQRPDATLALLATVNAGSPLTGEDTPLLACDLWEHAYYIDYRGDRARYLEAFWKLVNWEFVAANMR